ncbi:hypothetical protein [Curtobacterium sp. MCBD17_040]|uniref:hypothetical protein n=1 Tax=Curtobacterium sp. MCBD17_040 TaxID=2175674 RepID=UPI000DAF99A5|nr:hypothetical protein [Curtobacterium sp. MCBD17_040]WIB65435.1 hypothetical protein DEI94_18690 [Curtobacterium sp. MCBD17_040]
MTNGRSMLGSRTRIVYSAIDDYVVVGVHTIRPVLIRMVMAAPVALLGVAFLRGLDASGSDVIGSGWFCVLIACSVYVIVRLLLFPKPRIAPSSPEFATMPGYRAAVTGHVVELQRVLEAYQEAGPQPRRTRNAVRRLIAQTQYVATLLLLAARAEAPGEMSFWEQLELDHPDTLQQELTEQDDRLLRMRRELLTALRGTPTSPATAV